jgi:hypothetical protein
VPVPDVAAGRAVKGFLLGALVSLHGACRATGRARRPNEVRIERHLRAGSEAVLRGCRILNTCSPLPLSFLQALAESSPFNAHLIDPFSIWRVPRRPRRAPLLSVFVTP